MSEAVTCPSGLVLALEPPRLRRLLACGEVAALEFADACMDRACVPASALLEEDVFFVACWAIEQLPADPETQALVELCEIYAQAPSERLAILDPVLAFELDVVLTVEARLAREEAERETRPVVDPDDPLLGFPREDGA